MSDHIYFKCDRCGTKTEYASRLERERSTVRFWFWYRQDASKQYDLCKLCVAKLDAFMLAGTKP